MLILTNGEIAAFVGLSPCLPVICQAFWVPLGLKWGLEKSSVLRAMKRDPLARPLRPNTYWGRAAYPFTWKRKTKGKG